MIDIHCHVIPGVDDGAGDPEESMRMLRRAAAEGIRGIIATPHFNEQMGSELLEKRRSAWAQLNELAAKKKYPLVLYPGNEIYYSENVLRCLERGDALTLNGTRYVLVDFLPGTDYRYLRMAVQRLRYEGYLPILAHMERYACLEKEERVQELTELGVYLQVNTGAVTGDLGFRARRRILKLIRQDRIHFLGTDAHGALHRPPRMADCLSYIERKAGRERRLALSERNPGKMLRGEMICGDNTD